MPGEILTYNGVPLHIIIEKEISRTHILTDDGTTYLYTRWVFDVKTYIHPDTVSYLSTTNQQQGVFPGLTDRSIRLLLNQPRRPLIFSQNGNVVLATPSGNFPTDCKNGPIVESFDLVRDTGIKLWYVFIRIVAHIRECPAIVKPGNPGTPATVPIYTDDGILLNPDFQGTPPQPPQIDPVGALLSNRWTRTIDTDEDYLSYVETTGECVFDSSVLRFTGVFPDQFRIDLFQPIPPNCKRDNIRVTQMSDGCTFRYSFRDQERHFNTLPATRIEVYQTEGFSQMAPASAQGQALIGAAGGAVTGLLHAQSPLAGLGVVGGTALAFGFNTILYQVPKFHSHIIVRAWGNRNQSKMVLLEQALGMAFERVSTTRIVELMVSFERTGKFVLVELTNKTGQEEIVSLAKNYLRPGSLPDAIASVPIAGAIANKFVGQMGAILDFMTPAVPALPPSQVLVSVQNSIDRIVGNLNTGEDSPNAWYDQNETTVVNTYLQETNDQIAAGALTGPPQYYGNQQPPNSNYTRGTLLCNLIAQSLHNPCQLPPCPPDVYDSLGKPRTFNDIKTCLDFINGAVGNNRLQPKDPEPVPQEVPPVPTNFNLPPDTFPDLPPGFISEART